MKLLVFALTILVMTGCTSMVQKGSIAEAHKSFEQHNHPKTLQLISQAESIDTLSPEQNAKLVYLKAQTYEQMGEPLTALALYRYLNEQHPQTQYGYLAAKKLTGSE